MPGSMKLSFINGILTIAFGNIALLFPNINVNDLSIGFAIALIIGGVALILGSISRKDAVGNWHVFQLEGSLGILVGIMILAKPLPAENYFGVIIGLWALFTGIILLFTYSMKKMDRLPGLAHLLGGGLTLAFGYLILLNPFQSLRVIIVLIGLYAITYGIISIIHTSKIYPE
jgi:uncharacterized membrane protein HdeD (DUF308 family)